MIRADAQRAARALIRRLTARAEGIARHRNRRSPAQHRPGGHLWRNASRLWPDIFED